MSEIEVRLRQAASAVGVDGRIAALRKSVEEAIDTYPDDADPRYLTRLMDQRSALEAPGLDLIANVAVEMCDNDARRAALLAQPLASAAVALPRVRPAMTRLRRLLGEPV